MRASQDMVEERVSSEFVPDAACAKWNLAYPLRGPGPGGRHQSSRDEGNLWRVQ